MHPCRYALRFNMTGKSALQFMDYKTQPICHSFSSENF